MAIWFSQNQFFTIIRTSQRLRRKTAGRPFASLLRPNGHVLPMAANCFPPRVESSYIAREGWKSDQKIEPGRKQNRHLERFGHQDRLLVRRQFRVQSAEVNDAVVECR